MNISSWQIPVLLASMLGVAAVTRRRCLFWGMGFILAGVLPLAFIPPRGGFAYLVPSVGWAVYAGGLLNWTLEKLASRRVWLRGAAQALVLTGLFVLLAPWQRTWIEAHARAAHDMQARFLRYQDQIHGLIPAPRKGARILLLSDPNEEDGWDVVFLIRLFYGDLSLVAERMTVWKENHVHIDPGNYDYVLDWADGRFVMVSHK